MHNQHTRLPDWQAEPFPAAYYNTLDQIYHSRWTISKLCRIEMVRRMIRRLWPQGHPTRFIHVAGTSGKGSTCRFLERGLALVGKSGALFGPHLFDYCERFSIAEHDVSHNEIVEAWENRIRPDAIALALDHPSQLLSFHETNILMALVLFEAHHVEWAALETGLGGRYDQTMAVDAVATAITNVGRDHEQLLGSEPWQRAMDKAGIARRAIPCFTTEQDPLSRTVIASICGAVQAPFIPVSSSAVDDFRAVIEDVVANVYANHLPSDALLHAEHQYWNATLSATILQHLFPHLGTRAIAEQLVDTRLKGRGWLVQPDLYVDIAHNPDEIAALVKSINRRFPESEKIFIVGISEHRSPAEMFAPLADVARSIIVVGSFYAGQDPFAVQREIQQRCPNTMVLAVPDPRYALALARSHCQTSTTPSVPSIAGDCPTAKPPAKMLIITGSTYMIDQVLNTDPYLRHLNSTAGWRDRGYARYAR